MKIDHHNDREHAPSARSYKTLVGIYLAGLLSLGNATSNIRSSDHAGVDTTPITQELQSALESDSVLNYSSQSQKLLEGFNTMGLDHPLTSLIFARHENNTSRVDNLVVNYNKNHAIIQEYGPDLRLNPMTDENYNLAWSLLESGRREGVVANPKSKNYNAAGLFQYIPDTWRMQFNSFRRHNPDTEISNDRKNARANALVARHHFANALGLCDGEAGFALWGHHAGINRIVGGGSYEGYMNTYHRLTGQRSTSLLGLYNEILPWELVDEFMMLRDDSFTYVAKIMGSQQVVKQTQSDPSIINQTITKYRDIQKTKTRGAAIDDHNYEGVFDSDLIVQKRDHVVEQLLIAIADITDQHLTLVSPDGVINERHDAGIAVSAIAAGRGAKIKLPFRTTEQLRTSTTSEGLRYKRVRYLLELARIHGLCSLATERLPSGELVFHVGLSPHVTMQHLRTFVRLRNRNDIHSSA